MTDIPIPEAIKDKALELADMLNEPGASCDFGWFDSEAKALEQARRLSNKPYCLVKDWMWWDVPVSKNLQEQLGSESLSIVYAHHVIHDEGRRFSVGDFVRTSPLVTLHDAAFFETSSTLYILMGAGSKKMLVPLT